MQPEIPQEDYEQALEVLKNAEAEMKELEKPTSSEAPKVWKSIRPDNFELACVQGSMPVNPLKVDDPRGATKVNGTGDFEPMEQSP